jgi:hypothetical protein
MVKCLRNSARLRPPPDFIARTAKSTMPGGPFMCDRTGVGAAPQAGEARHGERTAIIEADDWDGPNYKASKDAAMVCPKIRNVTPA